MSVRWCCGLCANRYTELYAFGNHHLYTNTHIDRNGYTNSHADRDRYTDLHRDTQRYSDIDGHAFTDSNRRYPKRADTHTHAHAIAYTDSGGTAALRGGF